MNYDPNLVTTLTCSLEDASRDVDKQFSETFVRYGTTRSCKQMSSWRHPVRNEADYGAVPQMSLSLMPQWPGRRQACPVRGEAGPREILAERQQLTCADQVRQYTRLSSSAESRARKCTVQPPLVREQHSKRPEWWEAAGVFAGYRSRNVSVWTSALSGYWAIIA